MSKRRLVGTIISICVIAVIVITIALIAVGLPTSKNRPSIHDLRDEQVVSVALTNMFDSSLDTYKNSTSTNGRITLSIKEPDSTDTWHNAEFTLHIQNQTDFSKELWDSIKEAIVATVSDMDTHNLGTASISGQDYHSYKTTFSTTAFTDILKVAVIYCLDNEELQAYVDTIYEALQSDMEEVSSDQLYFDYTIDVSEQMSGIATLLDSYWTMLITDLVETIGESIEFTVYVDDDVNIVRCTIAIPDILVVDVDMTPYLSTKQPAMASIVDLEDVNEDELMKVLETFYQYMTLLRTFNSVF